MKISWNRSHPERHTGDEAFHIGDIVYNKETKDTYQVVGWDPCDWFKYEWSDGEGSCDDCRWGRVNMRLGLTKGSHVHHIAWGYMGSKHFCLGGSKVSWARRKDVSLPWKQKIK